MKRQQWANSSRQADECSTCALAALREACVGEEENVMREVFGVYEEPLIV